MSMPFRQFLILSTSLLSALCHANIPQQVYNGINQLIGSIDGNGNERAIVYDELDRPIRQFDPLLSISRTDYDGVDNVTFTTDALQRITQQNYDPLNRLIRRVDPIGAVTQFEYDAVGNLILERWPTTEAGQNEITRSYDKLNRKTREADLISVIMQTIDYDADGNVTQQM